MTVDDNFACRVVPHSVVYVDFCGMNVGENGKGLSGVNWK
jgi:hypothetical protein